MMYSAITLPLMFMTFSIWALWLFVYNSTERRQSALARMQRANQAADNETAVLAFKRESLTGNHIW